MLEGDGEAVCQGFSEKPRDRDKREIVTAAGQSSKAIPRTFWFDVVVKIVFKILSLYFSGSATLRTIVCVRCTVIYG